MVSSPAVPRCHRAASSDRSAGDPELWQHAAGAELPEGTRPGNAYYVGPLATCLLSTVATAMLAVATGTDTVGEAVVLGLVVGVGLAAAVAFVGGVFDPHQIEVPVRVRGTARCDGQPGVPAVGEPRHRASAGWTTGRRGAARSLAASGCWGLVPAGLGCTGSSRVSFQAIGTRGSGV